MIEFIYARFECKSFRSGKKPYLDKLPHVQPEFSRERGLGIEHRNMGNSHNCSNFLIFSSRPELLG